MIMLDAIFIDIIAVAAAITVHKCPHLSSTFTSAPLDMRALATVAFAPYAAQ
jgi:hypothetical protein